MTKEINPPIQDSNETKIILRNLEEKQRILKDKVFLLGQNLIEIKEKTQETILEIKKELEKNKEILDRMNSFIENISSEFPKFAKKDDLKILTKQLKMFEPLKYIKEQNK